MDGSPCVQCEADAARGWLLCVRCAAAPPNDLLEQLITKYETSEQWLANAEKFLETVRRDHEQYVKGVKHWNRALLVYQRLQQFLVTAIAMNAGWPEVDIDRHITVASGAEAWRRFLDYCALDTVNEKGEHRPPPQLLARAITALRRHSPAAMDEPENPPVSMAQ